MAKPKTRDAFLEAGIELFLQGGYDYTGTNRILERAQAPRGSFYHHFEDKQAFALAAAQRYYEDHLRLLDRVLSDDKVEPLSRIRAYFRTMRDQFGDSGWAGGCLLGLLGQELADRNEDARSSIAELFVRWRRRLADCLHEAHRRRQLARSTDPDKLAGFLLDAWEGALLQMKVQGSGVPLDRFLDHMDLLLPKN